MAGDLGTSKENGIGGTHLDSVCSESRGSGSRTGEGAEGRGNPNGPQVYGRLIEWIQCCEVDLNETVEECVKLSIEGAGELGIEHWVGDFEDRPFPSKGKMSYRGLLGFVTRNRDRISDSQDFLYYMTPWYEWALFNAESKLIGGLLSSSDSAADRDGLVKQIRDFVLQMDGAGKAEPCDSQHRHHRRQW